MKPSSQLPLRRLLSVLNPSYYQEPLLSRPAAQSAGVIAERPGATGMSLQPWGRGMQAALHCTSFGTILRLAERHAGLQLECLPCDPEGSERAVRTVSSFSFLRLSPPFVRRALFFSFNVYLFVCVLRHMGSLLLQHPRSFVVACRL